MQLHHPHAGLTPSQIEAAEARKARLARMSPAPVAEVVTSIELVGEATLSPDLGRLPEPTKTPWFYIVDEIIPETARQPRQPRIDEIQQIVAGYYGIQRQEIVSHRRTANITRPRHVAAYLAKTMTMKTLPEIGRRTGGRDHTTILHSIRTVERLIAQDAALAAEVEMLRATVESRCS